MSVSSVSSDYDDGFGATENENEDVDFYGILNVPRNVGFI